MTNGPSCRPLPDPCPIAADLLADCGLLIDGRIVPPVQEDWLEVEDPSTGDAIGRAPCGGAGDIDLAVAAARRCFDERRWLRLTPDERSKAMWRFADLLEQHAETIAHLDALDVGVLLNSARGMVASAIRGLRYYAGYCTKLNGETTPLSCSPRNFHAYTQPEPVGVVGAIIPWNAPFAVLVNKLAPAIAAGCPVVAKPAEQTPLSALWLARLLARKPVLPAGLVNIVTGKGPQAGARLAEHADVDKLTFTGSTRVGAELVRASAINFKRITLELGGKSPVFVFDDADMDMTIPTVANAIFHNSGQACIAGSRLYVQRRSLERVVDGVARIGRAMRVGGALDPAAELGPLVSERQMERVLGYIATGKAEGAELVSGGGRIGERGYYVEPTVFLNQTGETLTIVREEIFGPVLTVMPFDDIEEVGRLSNASSYGLSSGVFTSSLSVAHRAAQQIRAGKVWINCYALLDKNIPFGGFRSSGVGREAGRAGIEAFLENKSVIAAL